MIFPNKNSYNEDYSLNNRLQYIYTHLCTSVKQKVVFIKINK